MGTLHGRHPRAAYGSPIRKVWDKGAWLEVIVAPFDINPDVRNQGVVGVAMLGHEGDRLRLALHESPMDEGVILAAESNDKRINLVAEAQHEWLREDIQRQDDPFPIEWLRLPLGEMSSLQELIEEMATRARNLGKRLVLYPFGPKPLVFGTALFATHFDPLGSWYAYPVPRTYDLDYSVGIGLVHWARLVQL